MLRRIAIAVALLLAAVPKPNAMDFIWLDHLTVRASGPIEKGDAFKFAALPKFDTLELDSPGGFLGEALAMAANIDARGDIRTVVKPGASCASACAMVLFVSGETRVVHIGGRLGIHSCAMLDGPRDPVCNADIAANAAAHGVPWRVIEDFANQTDPSSMLWLGAEKAECLGLTNWSAKDGSTSPAHPCRNGSAVGKSNRPAKLERVPKDERGDLKIPRSSKEGALSSDSGTKPK
jgi:hypothetical protein